MSWLEDHMNSIVLGDSYELIKRIPDNSIDCIYTDIPYLYSGGYAKSSNKCGIGITQNLINQMKDIVNGIDYSIYDEFLRILKTGNIFIWCSMEQLPYTLNYFMDAEFRYNVLFWGKTNPIPLSNNSWHSDVEYCMHFRKKGARFNEGYNLKSKFHISPINVADKKEFLHPTIKPLDVVKRHLQLVTHDNDIVFDPYSGSGTTCVAAKEIGVRYIGIECNEEYHKASVNRLSGINIHGQTSIFTDFEKE